MPIYEYLCDSCHERTELLQRLDDAPATVCSSCGGALRKLVSAPAFQFKGSGWYLTDYAKKSGSGESSSGKSEGGAGKGESGSGESAASGAASGGDSAGGSSASSSSGESAAAATKTAPTKASE